MKESNKIAFVRQIEGLMNYWIIDYLGLDEEYFN